MIPAHNFYGPKLKCYGLKFLFAKIIFYLPRDCHVICHVVVMSFAM
jgi:hypothetical protein